MRLDSVATSHTITVRVQLSASVSAESYWRRWQHCLWGFWCLAPQSFAFLTVALPETSLHPWPLLLFLSMLKMLCLNWLETALFLMKHNQGEALFTQRNLLRQLWNSSAAIAFTLPFPIYREGLVLSRSPALPGYALLIPCAFVVFNHPVTSFLRQ